MLYAMASLMQAHAASVAHGPDVLKHPWYIAGIVADVGAWACAMLGYAHLPLFAVQAILAGSLALTVILAKPVLGITPRAREWRAIVVTTLGLALVSAAAGPESSTRPPRAFALALFAVAAPFLALSALWYRGGPGLGLAAIAGGGFGLTALAARGEFAQATLAGIVANPLTYLIVLGGAIGAVVYARALELSGVGPATAGLWVVEVLFPGIVGVLVLHDPIRPGWTIPAIAGTVLAITGCLVLAKSPAQHTHTN